MLPFSVTSFLTIASASSSSSFVRVANSRIERQSRVARSQQEPKSFIICSRASDEDASPEGVERPNGSQSSKSSRMCSYKKSPRNLFRICSSKTLDLKFFRISSYEKRVYLLPRPYPAQCLPIVHFLLRVFLFGFTLVSPSSGAALYPVLFIQKGVCS